MLSLKSKFFIITSFTLVNLLSAIGVSAQNNAQTNAQTNTQAKPSKASDVMVGFPATAISQVSFKNYRHYPYSKWAFNHAGAPYNLLSIPRAGAIDFFSENIDSSIGGQQITLSDKRKTGVADLFVNNDADSIIFIKNGQIKYEQYWNFADKDRQHIWFSATKSLVSTAFGILVAQDKVDLQASPAKYIVELKNSGFARTSIQNILNHSSAIDFKENYTDRNSDFLKYYAPALNMAFLPGARDAQPENTEIYGIHDFVSRFVKEDKTIKPGAAFDYNSANADVLGWLITRISGMPLNEFISKNIWSKLAVEHDASIAADRAYMPVATAGMNTTLRDAARFGSLILNDGRYNGEQIIPKSWVLAITTLSKQDKAKMNSNPKYKNESWQAYKNMWWILDAEQGEFAAVGIHGQVIYINKSKNVVAAMFSSQVKASSANNQQFRDKLIAIRQVAKSL